MVLKREFLLLASFVLFGIFISVGFVSAAVEIVSPTNATNMSVATAVLFNVTFLNGTDIFIGDQDISQANLNASFFANISGTWTSIGNSSTCVMIGASTTSAACWGTINITSSFADGIYSINATIFNLSHVQQNISVQGVNNLSHLIIFDNLPPAINISNISSPDGQTASGGNYSGSFTFNVTIIDAGRGVNTVFLNATNSTGGQNRTYTLTQEGSTERYSVTVDTSEFPDGSYNLTVWANDSEFNHLNNSAVVHTINFDNTQPTGSVSCSPSTVTAGDVTTCSCSSSDVTSGINSTSITANPSTSDTGTFSNSCSIVDTAGNSRTVSGTYLVEISSTAAAPGRGGGGVTAVTTTTKEHSFTRISPGTSGVATNYGAVYGIDQISIDVTAVANNVMINVVKHDNRPSSVSSKDESVYRWLEITVENVADVLESGVITIQVEKAWVSANDLERDDIVLSRFENGEWNELTTVFEREDDTNYYYTVEITSFSFFAIGGKKAEVIEAAPVDDGDAVAPTPTPEEEAKGISTGMLVGIIAIIVIIVVIFWFVKKK